MMSHVACCDVQFSLTSMKLLQPMITCYIEYVMDLSRQEQVRSLQESLGKSPSFHLPSIWLGVSGGGHEDPVRECQPLKGVILADQVLHMSQFVAGYSVEAEPVWRKLPAQSRSNVTFA